MGLTLDPTLERLLNDLGFTWPEVDEMELFSLGSTWTQFGGQLGSVTQSGEQTIQQLTSTNKGDAMDAFMKTWQDDKSPSKVLSDATTGVQVGGAAILFCAGLVLALKINTIINLIILAVEIAEAIATAVPTFGASLAEIPIFKEICQRIIGAIVNEVIMAIMG
jgi:hypothetical protein